LEGKKFVYVFKNHFQVKMAKFFKEISETKELGVPRLGSSETLIIFGILAPFKGGFGWKLAQVGML
jgi:hypothetical protein